MVFSSYLALSRQNDFSKSFLQHIRVLNFGQRKTGWLTYNPKKVYVDNLGGIKKMKEKWIDKQPQRQS